jgi:hypothetical protein
MLIIWNTFYSVKKSLEGRSNFHLAHSSRKIGSFAAWNLREFHMQKSSCLTEKKMRLRYNVQPLNTVSENSRTSLWESHETNKYIFFCQSLHFLANRTTDAYTAVWKAK